MEDQPLGGRYELRGIIGTGGMARVYRAFDRVLKREVAIKMLAEGALTELSSLERFRREARAAAGLTHPNIVAIFDWGETGGAAFMVMELIPGTNLKQLIRERGPLPEREALDIAAQVAAALQVAHEHGIIHRDVKPQNILVEPDGQVKMTDFGIARAAGLTQLTATDAIAGSPYYLSPEQAQRATVDHRTDIYSLGAVLYEMLTGSELFHGTPIEVALQHVNTPPPSPRVIRPALSAETESAILRALAKDPKRRFTDAAAMRGTLRRIRDTLPSGEAEEIPAVVAQPDEADPVPGRTTQWRLQIPPVEPRRHRDGTLANPWVPAIPVALIILLVTGGLAYLAAANALGSHSPHLSSRTFTPVVTTPRGGSTHTRRHVISSVHPRASATHTPVPAAVPTATTAATPVATSPPALAAISSGSDPLDTVRKFYRLVSQHDFAAATALWSPSLQANDTPSEFIDKRFAHTASIQLKSASDVSVGQRTAVVAVDVYEVLDNGRWQEFVFNWNLVMGPSGWLLDSNNYSSGDTQNGNGD